MKDFMLVGLVVLIFLGFGACASKPSIDMVKQPIQNISTAGRAVTEKVKNIETGCVIDHNHTMGLNCSFDSYNAPAGGNEAEQAEYQACVEKYYKPIHENWAAMTSWQRAQIGMKIISECTN